ncbi:MAG TPA: hypothetical protein PLS77_09725 [Anaerolineaceae bacterium]|jgi:hypothetical protein|nr:hypothetical protein [Anaerolineaceae bacterium]HQF45154.1 hypothetical protein [Anaerolineaceae bacterium]HQH35972.1 hypothetical protein [Anaerolineaceae bacterium]HQJ03152.1 hypothetical protein [Anaerolineaceae bacterium]HQO97767.1 hypothetical protein [Anaerolineaceae bacterium]
MMSGKINPFQGIVFTAMMLSMLLAACNPVFIASPAGSVRYQPADELLDTDPTHNTTTVNAPNLEIDDNSVAILFLIDRSSSAKYIQDQYELPRFIISLLDSCPGSKIKNISIGLSTYPNNDNIEEDYGELIPLHILPKGRMDLALLNQLEYGEVKVGHPTNAFNAAQEKLNQYPANYKILVFITDNNLDENIDPQLIDSINETIADNETIDETYIIISKDDREYNTGWDDILKHDKNKVVELIQETSDHYQDTINNIFKSTNTELIKYLGLEECVAEIIPAATNKSNKFAMLVNKTIVIPGNTMGLKLYGITPIPNAVFTLKLEDTGIPQTYQMISDVHGRFESPYISISPNPDCTSHTWSISGPFSYYWYEAATPGFSITNTEEGENINRIINGIEQLTKNFIVESKYSKEIGINKLIREYGHCYELSYTVDGKPGDTKVALNDPGVWTEDSKTGKITLETKEETIASNNVIVTLTGKGLYMQMSSFEFTIHNYYQPWIEPDVYNNHAGVLTIPLNYEGELTLSDDNITVIYLLYVKENYQEPDDVNCYLTNINTGNTNQYAGYELCGGGEANRDCNKIWIKQENYKKIVEPPYWEIKNNQLTIVIGEHFITKCGYDTLLVDWGHQTTSAEWKNLLCKKIDAGTWDCKMIPFDEIEMRWEEDH